MNICKWHRCGAEFEPGHGQQKFCSHACQRARASWRKDRGAPLVDLLLDQNQNALDDYYFKLRSEIGKASA